MRKEAQNNTVHSEFRERKGKGVRKNYKTKRRTDLRAAEGGGKGKGFRDKLLQCLVNTSDRPTPRPLRPRPLRSIQQDTEKQRSSLPARNGEQETAAGSTSLSFVTLTSAKRY